jgi:O-antigen ligase
LAARPSPAAALFALLLPLVFLHAHYEPSVTVVLGGSDATLYLSDWAVLAIGTIGLVVGLRSGFGPLRPGLTAYAGGAAFLVLVLAATLYGPALAQHYDFTKHLLTAAKLCEYSLLALATPLILRRPADLRLPLWTLTLWNLAASVIGVLQFLGIVNEQEGRRPGQREPSFVGIHDLAALSGATLSLGILAIALRRERRLGIAAGIAGGVGAAVSGAVAAVVGIAAAAVAAAVYGRVSLRRGLAIAAIVTAVAACVVALRTLDTRPLLDLLGVSHPEEIHKEIEVSWKQRFALAYIGGRIFLAHPLIGVGFEGATEPEHFLPYVDDARRRFPSMPARVFPTAEHRWGVQNAYVQAAADMGALGLVAFLALFLTPLVVGIRAVRRAPPELVYAAVVPILWILVAMSVWLGLGIVAGIPLVGLTWLSVGLAAASAAWTARAAV